MLRFAASRLCGRARDGSLAAIMVFPCYLAGSIAGPATLSRRSRRSAAWAGKAHIFATGARLRHSRQKKPRSGEGRGFRTGDPPWGEGKMIALSTSTVPNDPQFLLGPLTPSLLVCAADPRHDLSRR